MIFDNSCAEFCYVYTSNIHAIMFAKQRIFIEVTEKLGNCNFLARNVSRVKTYRAESIALNGIKA